MPTMTINERSPGTASDTTAAVGGAHTGKRRPEVEQRDRAVLTALRRRQNGLTRDELADKLQTTTHAAYLSLWRLHQDGLVEREGFRWKAVH